jgi:hypothetical protein
MSVNSNLQASQQNMINFLFDNFFHLLPMSLTPVINPYFQLSPQIFVKILNGPHGTLRGPGETDSWKMKSKTLVSDSL